MSSSLLLSAMLVVLPDGTASGELFKKLDKNGDSILTDDELNSTQKTFFQRALRVADKNDDRALTAEEFSRAVSDPKPIELPAASLSGRINGFDPRMLDRNGDGNISLDEVPAPLKDRFKQLLERSGQASIPVDKVQEFLRGESPDPNSAEKPGMTKVPEIKPATAPGRRDEKNKNSDQLQSGNVFSQLDRDADGKLSGEEIPARMRENIRSADVNKDGRINPFEFEEVFKRRMQMQKKD